DGVTGENCARLLPVKQDELGLRQSDAVFAHIKSLPELYEHIPIYARAGEISPLGREVEYTAQEQDHALTLNVYTGADARFTLYEDEGTTYDYEKGAFSRIPIAWSEAERQLTIGEREGSFEGMPAVRTITVRLIAPASVTTRTVTYTGTELTIQ
ncbi:MAG: DUF5110 domain-containing protein, partial [Alistipes sp.]|nr:DUF5110 domain-containing protein [Alistipes sp.]